MKKGKREVIEAKETNWFILIPIVLNVLVLLVLPTSLRQYGLERTVIIAVAALGMPWLLYFVIAGRFRDRVN